MYFLKNSTKIEKITYLWLIISLLFWNIYIFFIDFVAIFLYLDLFLIPFGIILILFHEKIKIIINSIKFKPFTKFMFLGYLMILIEEVIAALVNNINEGFLFELWLIRILQFWAFNILAFTGFFLAWYYLYTKYDFSIKHTFYLGGIFGIYSEKIYLQIFSNPIGFIFYVIPVIFIYGLILYPSILSIKITENKKIVKWYNYIQIYILILLCSLIPLLIISLIRTNYPFIFPPTTMIPS